MSSTKDETTTPPPPTESVPIPTFTNPTDEQIYYLLDKKGAMVRSEIVKKTGIARSTVYDALLRMMLRKLIRNISDTPTGPGRPKVYFEIIRYSSDASAPAIMSTK